MESDVRHACDADRDAVLDTISRAFFDDPVWSWVFADASQRSAYYAEWWQLSIGAGLRHESVLVTPACEAVAIWIPPGASEYTDDEEVRGEALQRRASGARGDEVVAAVAQFEEAHPRDEPHWYLSVVATSPAHRGRALGVGLIAHHLAVVDAAHLPAYLESSNPANLDRYRRLGFTAHDEFRMGTDGPVVTTMWRAAR
jgi:ribosomal protein S18 acetylase RimI-like enzyme